MFVKRDKRKISEIFSDAKDDRSALLLARRTTEFAGSTQAFFSAETSSALSATRLLSLYNNKLSRVAGMSAFVSAAAPLDSLVLGANQLESLPASLAGLRATLTRLWVEDNRLSGLMPPSILACTRLRVLRLSGNAITSAAGIGALTALEELALDGNALTSLPAELGRLTALKVLQVRGNALESLPEEIGLCTALEALYASSNRLSELPRALGGCTALATLAVNSNPHLLSLPASLADAPRLARVVAANCGIVALPLQLAWAWARALPAAIFQAAPALVAARAAATGDDAELAPWDAFCAASDEAGGEAGDEAEGDDAERSLRQALRGSNPRERLFFTGPGVAEAAPRSAGLVVNLSGNPIGAAAEAALARRAAARKELADALGIAEAGGAAAAGAASEPEGPRASRSSPILSANHGAHIIIAAIAARQGFVSL
jgi:hypothetical protein